MSADGLSPGLAWGQWGDEGMGEDLRPVIEEDGRRFDYERDRTWWIQDQARALSAAPNELPPVVAEPNSVPTERVIYLCPVCRIQWTAPGAAMRCCETTHRNGRDAYSDELGRAGVLCHGRQLYRVRGVVRRSLRGAA